MAITYDNAAELAYRVGKESWNPERGTFCFDDREICEDDEVYVFGGGAREFIVDGDDSYAGVGGGMAVVYKSDGRLEWNPWVFLMSARPGLRTRQNPRPVYFR